MHRPTVGLIALFLLLAWAALWIWPAQWEGGSALQGACLRIGIVLGAIWIALPQVGRIPGWFLQLGTVAAVVIAYSPRRMIFVVPLLVVIWMLRPRKKKNAAGEQEKRQPARRG